MKVFLFRSPNFWLLLVLLFFFLSSFDGHQLRGWILRECVCGIWWQGEQGNGQVESLPSLAF